MIILLNAFVESIDTHDYEPFESFFEIFYPISFFKIIIIFVISFSNEKKNYFKDMPNTFGQTINVMSISHCWITGLFYF